MTTPSVSRLAWYRRPAVWIGFVLSILSLVLLALIVDVRDLLNQLQRADLRYIALGFFTIMLPAISRAVRWQVILGQGVSFWNTFHAENIGYLINTVLPLRAGEPARAYVLSRAPNQRPVSAFEALSSVILLRLVDMVAAVVLLGLVLPALEVADALRSAGYTLLVFSGIGIVGLTVAANSTRFWIGLARTILTRVLPERFSTPLLKWAEHFLDGLSVLRHPGRSAAAVGTSVLMWANYVAYYWLILAAFRPSAPLAWGVLATCAGALSLALPSSPGAIGVFHFGMVLALAPIVGDKDTATAYAIVVHAVEVIVHVLLGVYSLVATGNSLQRVNEAATALEVESAQYDAHS